MQKKICYSICFLILFLFEAKGQDYKTALGFRLGSSQGITLKHFIKEDAAMEAILSTRWGGFVVTGIFEKHFPLAEINGLKWFIGGGGYLGFWTERSKNKNIDRQYAHTSIGVAGIIGVEYTFPKVPINLGLDWKPEFRITGPSGFYGSGTGFSVRYAFK